MAVVSGEDWNVDQLVNWELHLQTQDVFHGTVLK